MLSEKWRLPSYRYLVIFELKKEQKDNESKINVIRTIICNRQFFALSEFASPRIRLVRGQRLSVTCRTLEAKYFIHRSMIQTLFLTCQSFAWANHRRVHCFIVAIRIQLEMKPYSEMLCKLKGGTLKITISNAVDWKQDLCTIFDPSYYSFCYSRAEIP